MKQAREYKAFDSVAAFLVLKDGQYIAKVHAHYGNSGGVTVTVYDKASCGPQTAKAGGYGYDKFTAAISGMTIDGVRLTNHCGEKLGKGPYPEGFKAPAGYHMSNYNSETGGYSHCYRYPALQVLEHTGYTVYQVV